MVNKINIIGELFEIWTQKSERFFKIYLEFLCLTLLNTQILTITLKSNQNLTFIVSAFDDITVADFNIDKMIKIFGITEDSLI